MNRAILPLLLFLSACGSGDKAELDKIDGQLTTAKGKDPALAAALESPILVDPSLASQANDDSVKPGVAPNPAAIPAGAGTPPDVGTTTLGSLAQEQARIDQQNFAGCNLNVSYSMSFAARAPADLPLFPKGQATEAAGSDAATCKLRVVSYIAPAAMEEVVRYYTDLATSAGYAAGAKGTGKEQLVSGRRADGAAFYAMLKPAGEATAVDLVTNAGS